MKVTRRSRLADVAAEVAKTLASAGIEAVLTGGACATLYSKGEYQSEDLDFILQSAVTQRHLDAAMETIGFKRSADRYEHGETSFFVEFPRGPLALEKPEEKACGWKARRQAAQIVEAEVIQGRGGSARATRRATLHR